MSSLRDLSKRRRSLQSTRKITATMKMIATSKMHRFQPTLRNTNDYAAAVEQLLQQLIRRHPTLISPFDRFIGQAEEKGFSQAIIITLTSDRGLCGGFNNQVMSQAMQEYAALRAQGTAVKMLPMGKYAYEKCIARSLPLLEGADGLGDKSFAKLYALSSTIYEHLKEQEGVVYKVVYTKFISPLQQVVCCKTLAPFVMLAPGVVEEEMIPYEFEPSSQEILARILPTIIRARLYYYIAQSTASEHAARMQAMDMATRNADDIMKQLEIKYNRTRQNQITREMIEIISGAESL